MAKPTALPGSPSRVFGYTAPGMEDNVLAARACGWTAFTIDHEGDTVRQMRRHLASVGITA